MSANSPSTRLIGGVHLPAIGSWAIESEQSYVGFRANRGAVSVVRGRFGGVSGVIDIADDPSDSTIVASVAEGSVRTGSPDRDEVLCSIEHFDVDDHPTATFRSTRTRWAGRRLRVAGALTLLGLDNGIEFDVSYRGTVVDRSDAPRSVFLATLDIDREAWGLTWNLTLSGGAPLLDRWVRLEIELEARLTRI